MPISLDEWLIIAAGVITLAGITVGTLIALVT